MSVKPILVHTHFHKRRTGVTRSIENVFSFFDETYDASIYGYGVSGRKISFSKMLKLIFSRQYFVLHCHRNNEILRALLFRFLGGKFKLISTRHAESKPSSFTCFLLKKSDVVIALTKSMQAALPFPSVVIGHGISLEQFYPNKTEKRSEIRQKNILTCAGRVRTSKGQKVLVATFAPILKQHADWALVIVGKVDKPEFLVELQQIVKDFSVENQVYFIKETPEIVSFYQASHSVIVPSFTEGFSLVCAEAMACGCNVLATRNVGVHSEMISENENGYLFEANATEELQQLLQKMCEGTLPHLGTAAQKEIETKWTAQIEAQKLMEVYQN